MFQLSRNELSDESSIEQAYWIQFELRIRLDWLDVSHTSKCRVFRIDHSCRVNRFWCIHCSKGHFLFPIDANTDITRAPPSTKITSESHSTRTSNNREIHHDQVFPFENRLMFFSIVEEFELKLVRVRLTDEVEIFEPKKP